MIWILLINIYLYHVFQKSILFHWYDIFFFKIKYDGKKKAWNKHRTVLISEKPVQYYIPISTIWKHMHSPKKNPDMSQRKQTSILP